MVTKQDSEISTIRIHTISSNVQGMSLLNYKRKRPPKHNYDKYLTGRSYRLFKSGIRSKETLRTYKKGLFYFCDHLQMTTDELIRKYNPILNLNNNYVANVAGLMELQKIIEDYVLRLQTWVSEGKIKPATCANYLPPLKLFCDMNDIILNWKKIHKLLPRNEGNAADESYHRDMIQKMLEHSDLRTKIPILFMASGGMRLGAFADLRDGHITPIYGKNSKLLAAHVIVYKGTDDEYDTFITPEAYNAYLEYKNLRTKYGEKISKQSPLILRRFNINKNRSSPSIDNKPVSYMTIVGLLKAVAYKAGIRTQSEHYNDRYNIKIAHGFRKFFNTTLRSIKTKDGQPAIQYIHKEWMMGHTLKDLHAMEENYDRSDRVGILLDDYLRAVSELTISDEERLKVEVKNLKTDISNMKTVSVELQEKDKQIQELINKQEEMERKFQQILARIDVASLK